MGMHKTWVDEDVDNDGGDMWQAVCEGCSWSSSWVHADNYEHLLNGKRVDDSDLDEDGLIVAGPDDELSTPNDQAHEEAARLGEEHEENA